MGTLSKDIVRFANAEDQITVVGSFVKARIPESLDDFFKNGILIDQRNGKPMEMDGYSLYLGLKCADYQMHKDFSAERKLIVDAVVKRMKECAGFWQHGHWSEKENEIHLRFTAAAIRLLVQARVDGVYGDDDAIVGALKKHLSYHQNLDFGVWFLHDTLELSVAEQPHPSKPAKNKIWGKQGKNCLVLNTHIDTVATALDVLKHIPMSHEDRESIEQLLDSALTVLARVLDSDLSRKAKWFRCADSAVRSIFFKSFTAHDSKVKRMARGGFRKAYFYARKHLQLFFPLYAWPDGYIGRDIGPIGTNFEYHYVTACDLAKLMLHLQSWNRFRDEKMFARCGEIVDAALDYAINSSYRSYLLSSITEYARPVLLCETILARLATKKDKALPASWLEGYCAIRRLVAPSPALIGYDPWVVEDSRALSRQHGVDRGQLKDGSMYFIDYINERAAFNVDSLNSINVL